MLKMKTFVAMAARESASLWLEGLHAAQRTARQARIAVSFGPDGWATE
jgi:hypothetical protein